jgi:dTDP-4-amino-4,6-dideoxygalactose transaminase
MPPRFFYVKEKMKRENYAMIPFIDLAAQQKKIRKNVEAGFKRVLNHGAYIMGPEVYTLEKELADFCGAKHVLSCANGTDALALVLMAKKVRPGEAIFCPSFTFAATAEVIAWLGATPIFVDIDPKTFNIDIKSLKMAYKTAKDLGLKPTGIIPVDLFGLPADYDKIESFAQENNLWLLCDAAQGFGGNYKGRKIGTIGLATSTSFFPAKPLGCYGDGGAVFTDNDELIDTLKSLRIHGMGSDKYDNIRIGMNGRLDTIQAVVLIEKLKIFEKEIKQRNKIAKAYNIALKDMAIIPEVPRGLTSTWAQYTLRVQPAQRAKLIDDLKAKGIPTAVYYPIPLHRQTAYKHFPSAGNGLPATDEVCAQVVSLPMHPYLTPDTQNIIIAAVRASLAP